jgi:hypothetical protein
LEDYLKAAPLLTINADNLILPKKVEELTEKKGDIITAKMIVYAGDTEQYYTFISAEAYHSLKD